MDSREECLTSLPPYSEETREEFEKLWMKLQPKLQRIALNIVRNSDDTSDIIQEAYLRAVKGYGTFKKKDFFDAWVIRIVHHIFVDLVRSRSVLVRNTFSLDAFRYTDDSGEANWEIPDTAALSPQEQLERQVHKEYVHNALSHITHRYRIPLLLFYMKGCSYEEIADILTIPLGTVKSRIYRGRRLLRIAMDNWED